ncbi:hypothetical protein ACISU4_35265 [Streptomyces wuyuanensis]|uniref:hypothetical protein n=1 Tax=Streptomyces wuyuanensis TaxID=1196353 RepID=UPI00381A48D5
MLTLRNRSDRMRGRPLRPPSSAYEQVGGVLVTYRYEAHPVRTRTGRRGLV